MRNAGLDEAQAGIKIAGRNINNLRYANDTTLMAESEEDLRSLLMKVRVEKLAYNSTFRKLNASGDASSHITSWQIDGKQWKQWQTLFFGAPKLLQMMNAAMKLKGVCSLEESYHKPRQHNKKQRHYFANKGPSSQFSSVQFSRSVVSNSLWPHEPQHARPPVHHQLPESTKPMSTE